MADSPIGVTFMPTADAAANGPRQAGIEGAGTSDLAQAFKILSLHLPSVLGAPAIAPKRLLTSQGSAGVAAPAAANPYSAVFQALLQSMGAGGGNDPMAASAPSAAAPTLPSSLSSLFNAPTSYQASTSPTSDYAPSPVDQTSGPPAPKVTFHAPPGGDVSSGSLTSTDAPWTGATNQDFQYI